MPIRRQAIIPLMSAVLFALTLAVHIVHASVVVGNALPSIELVDWQGRPFRLADLRGKVVVIDFWASWCTICRQTLPSVEAMGQHFPAGQVVVLGINIDKDAATADRFLRDALPAATMTMLRDPQGAVMSRFGAEGMPAIYVIDADGIVRFAEAGYGPARLSEVESAVTRALPPTPAL